MDHPLLDVKYIVTCDTERQVLNNGAQQQTVDCGGSQHTAEPFVVLLDNMSPTGIPES